jgi:hypothetical protein
MSALFDLYNFYDGPPPRPPPPGESRDHAGRRLRRWLHENRLHRGIIPQSAIKTLRAALHPPA